MAGGNGFRIFDLYCNLNERERGAAEGFVLTEDKREVAANLRVGERDGGEHISLDVFLRVRAGDEAQAHVRSDKAL